jgi:type III restriction enzyme
MELKEYQRTALDTLGEFLRMAAAGRMEAGFQGLSGRPYRATALESGTPYVCLRLPTGGGKTLLAAHAVGLARGEFLRRDRAMVLWLAPTNAIVEQTLRALRHPRHPYRDALEAGCEAQLEVTDIEGALALSPAAAAGATVVLVATLQALRVERTEGRRVYEANGSLQGHFSGLSPSQARALERQWEGGPPIPSLANLLRLHRPLVIVDEAHNARTPLSFETLTRVRPAAVLEFTATPRPDSNVLLAVSAEQLKAEDMVKLPIRLESRSQWREAVQAALQKRAALEVAAAAEREATGEYLRPIVLFQAQSRQAGEAERVTVDVLRQALLNEFEIPAEQIAEGTGEKWEIPDNLLSEACPVRFVLTVQALREGWDCPFAYVLCSVAHLSGATAVEQILGRLLRLPGARAKRSPDLNRAYGFATSHRFHEAAQSLVDGLVENGFERYAAAASVEGGQGEFFMPEGEPVTAVLEQPLDLARLPDELRARLDQRTVTLPEGAGQRSQLSYTGPPLRPAETEILTAAAAAADRGAIEALALRSAGRPASPAARGVALAVPQLAYRRDGQPALFEDQFREEPWRLSDCDPALSETEFPSDDPLIEAATVDVEKGGSIGLRYVAQLRSDFGFQDAHAPATIYELAAWLDRGIPHPDIVSMESSLYLLRTIETLLRRPGMDLPRLAAARFRLRDAAARKIAGHRQAALDSSYDRLLFAPGAPVEAGPEVVFRFPNSAYPAARLYAGHTRFAKHFYDLPGEMNGEEADCAALIDASPEVEIWVRNLERHEQLSFWLPTARDKFYPDFVARLRDGRLAVIEYKGGHLADGDDTREKQAVGDLWAARSGGRCIFLLLRKTNMASELRRALAAGPATAAGR